MFVLNYNALAYSFTTLGAVLMNSVFQFYYVKLFVSHYKISTSWFNTVQIIYMIWNAVNDPLFGYFQDHSNLHCLKHRRLNILYGAPFFVLSFLIPWFGWADESSPMWIVGIHLLVCLCVYDSLFTFVLLAQCSLFAEISRNQNERQTLIIYSQLASILGTLAIFIAEVTSNQMKNIPGLQTTCICIAIISLMLFIYSGKNIVVEVNRTDADKIVEDDGNWNTAVKTTSQIMRNKNFLCFVIMNFCQVFHSTYCANFFSIFREQLIGADALPQLVQNIGAGAAFMLPPVIVLLIQPMITKYGSYWLIYYSFYLKIVMGVVLYILGYTSPVFITLFMIFDTSFVGAAFSLFNLSLSDIIDDDQKLNQRSHPVSSMVFGLNALVTKPAQSVAPMLIVYILKLHGYEVGDQTRKSETSDVRNAMFSIMVAIPVFLGGLQLLCWRVFSLGVWKSRGSQVIPSL